MTWALIDASCLAHKARHTMGALAHAGERTGVIFGFLEQLRTVCTDPRIATTNAAIFFDSKKSYRRDVFPGYKQKRRKNRTPEEWDEINSMESQLDLLRRSILREVGFPVRRQQGLESDDLMAQAALEVGRSVIVTGDGDLFQCISQKAHWFDPTRDLYLDEGGLLQHKRVGPTDWLKVKCLAGCDTDDVPGVPGIGEKTATDYIWKLLKPGKRLTAIQSSEGQEIAKRNIDLISLPHPKTEPVNLDPPTYDKEAFFVWAKKLGFARYLTGQRQREWEAFLSGDPLPPPARDAAAARRVGAVAPGLGIGLRGRAIEPEQFAVLEDGDKVRTRKGIFVLTEDVSGGATAWGKMVIDGGRGRGVLMPLNRSDILEVL